MVKTRVRCPLDCAFAQKARKKREERERIRGCCGEGGGGERVLRGAKIQEGDRETKSSRSSSNGEFGGRVKRGSVRGISEKDEMRHQGRETYHLDR